MSHRSSRFWLTLSRIRRRSPIPVVLCFDVEPDARLIDRASAGAWEGFERLIGPLQELRTRLSEVAGAPVAFTSFLRMDPQVAETWGSPGWVAERYGDLLSELTDSGDELGVHTHTWRWDASEDEWIADFVDPEWQRECLNMGLDAFESAFERPCRAHRGGDHFVSPQMLAQMSERGIDVDLTVEPGLTPSHSLPDWEQVRGRLPDYSQVPSGPYHSSPSVFPARDPAVEGPPLLVPLMSAPSRRPPFRRLPLTPAMPRRAFVQRLAAQLVRGSPAVIALTIRSDSALDADEWRLMCENLEHLARHDGMVFMTASAAVASLRNGGAP